MWSYNYELYHHGILGMKWGVRRYQNRDGTLTAKGKVRQRETENAAASARYNPEIYKRSRKVVDKYEKKKSDEIKRLDSNYENAGIKYWEYVDKYMEQHPNVDYEYEAPYNKTKKGSGLRNEYTNSLEVQRQAYLGSEWYNKYAKELSSAYYSDLVKRMQFNPFKK